MSPWCVYCITYNVTSYLPYSILYVVFFINIFFWDFFHIHSIFFQGSCFFSLFTFFSDVTLLNRLSLRDCLFSQITFSEITQTFTLTFTNFLLLMFFAEIIFFSIFFTNNEGSSSRWLYSTKNVWQVAFHREEPCVLTNRFLPRLLILPAKNLKFYEHTVHIVLYNTVL